MNDMASHIREQFPDKKDSINLLMAKDPEFRVLCDDYHACVKALRYWVGSKEPEAETRVSEYRTLVRELQDEISQALAAPKPEPLD